MLLLVFLLDLEIPALLILGDSLYHDAVNLGVAEGITERMNINRARINDVQDLIKDWEPII